MAKSNVERQRTHRAKRRRHRILDDLHPYIAARLAKEMKFFFRINEKGEYKLDWKFSDECLAFLHGYAQAKGVDYCEMMDDLSNAIVDRAMDKGDSDG